ncbi:alpha/beta hydrolase-fold protein [Asticcacaulis sp. BYS171W]|uniref:Alpha/beta hydrolase-fold protein n=1 Tax=Asticcacaulis aquaticus TaxID=2984212 RepID=A0ABT5HWK0_9CAUL|nr:alpha/beta hydrolase-fold protein [Asticcacaulis aquaticus]MDC7684462.1 alpha/beta hydrolase-fold protein [Asticcacaulis aquaticus]
MRLRALRVLLVAGFALAANSALGEEQGRSSPPITLQDIQVVTPGFWERVAANGGTPLVEYGKTPDDPVKVTFLWRGDDLREVELSWPVWTPDRRENHLQRIDGSDVWFKTVMLPPRTRLSYQIAPDLARGAPGDREAYRASLMAALQFDPRNPKRFGQMSLLELKGTPDQPFVESRPGVQKGRVWSESIDNPLNGRTYEITFYRPAGVAKNEATPLVVLFDAERYLKDIPTPTILDNMIADGAIAPISAILIRNPTRQSRSEDLACNPAFSEAMVKGLMPWVRERVKISEDAKDIAIAGSSYGGLMAVCTVLTYPDVFGNALSQSGSFWWDPAGKEGKAPDDLLVIRRVRESPPSPARFYLDAGVLEQRPAGEDNSGSIFQTTEALYKAMKAKGYDASFHPFAGGHDDAAWRGTLSDGLIILFGDRQ